MNTAATSSHPIVQPPLPQEENALAPVISGNTLATTMASTIEDMLTQSKNGSSVLRLRRCR